MEAAGKSKQTDIVCVLTPRERILRRSLSEDPALRRRAGPARAQKSTIAARRQMALSLARHLTTYLDLSPTLGWGGDEMRVFISYAGPDRPAALALKTAIENTGNSVWLAPANMQGQQSFQRQIAQAICEADFFAVVCSANAASSDWVERELTHALANSKTVVPILVGDVPLTSWLRLLIGPLDWVDAQSGFTLEAVNSISARLGVRSRTGRVITTLNLKGGVGKTTLTANLAAEAYLTNNTSTLLIDLDPQYNLTQFFLGERPIELLRDQNRTVLELLEFSRATANDISRIRDKCFSLLTRDGERANQTPIDLLPGHDGLFAYTIDERDETQRRTALANLAAFIGATRPYYDVILIDVNPSASFLTRCALSVADHVMAPVRPERYALNGLKLLERWMARVKGRPFDASEVSVVLNKVADRHGSANQNIESETRNAIGASTIWASTLAPLTIPFSVTLQPPSLDSTSDRPIDMIAQYNRAGPALRKALKSTANFVHSRARVIHA